MANSFEDLQRFGKTQFDATTATSQSLVNGFQTIAAETTEYSKKSLENGSAFLGKLLSARSLESAFQLQSEFARASYADFVAQAEKLGELCSDLARKAFKPAEDAVASSH